MTKFIIHILNGLRLGSIFALVSLGYTMVYGIAKLINFAHGDIIMIGAYTAFLSLDFFRKANLPIYLAVIPAVIVCTLLGMFIERVAYRPLRNSPRISNLITAIGVSLLLQNLVMSTMGSGAKPFPKVFNMGNINIGNAQIDASVILSIVITIILSIALKYFMDNTKQGLAMKATSEDYGAAKLVGINVDSTISKVFGIGSALAAVASILYVSAYPQITPYMGAMLGIKAFVAAVIGGIGMIQGAVVGGFLLGVIEALTKAYISSGLSDAIVFSILIITLIVKPTGIFGKSDKEKV